MRGDGTAGTPKFQHFGSHSKAEPLADSSQAGIISGWDHLQLSPLLHELLLNVVGTLQIKKGGV